jgi:hypothetical protein
MQMTQEKVADSWIDIECFRLLVLRTAWRIDKYKDYRTVRKDIAAVKVMLPRVLHDVAQRALRIQGSLGVSQETGRPRSSIKNPVTNRVIEERGEALEGRPRNLRARTCCEVRGPSATRSRPNGLQRRVSGVEDLGQKCFQRLLFVIREAIEQRERREQALVQVASHLTAGFGEGEQLYPAVLGLARSRDQSQALEPIHHTGNVRRVETEPFGEFAGGERILEPPQRANL